MEKLIGLFEPFILHNEQDFVAENVEKLDYALVAEEKQQFGYDTRSIDWWDYWLNMHIPALRKWTLSADRGASAGSAAGDANFNLRQSDKRKRRDHQNGYQRSNVAIFLTGSTGYIGAHVAANLLQTDAGTLNVLVRARDPHEAEVRFWQALQLHLDFPRFYDYLQTRIRIFRGDLTTPRFGLGNDEYDRLIHTTDSVIHCAASLESQVGKSCLNVNLRGTLEVVQLAQRAHYYHGLQRFSHVSTGCRGGEAQQ